MSDAMITQWGKARSVSSFRALSMLGSELTVFALVLRERGHGATFVSVLMACGTVSLVVMVPLAGWISDRFSTRQIIPFTSLLQAALIFSIIFQHNMVLLTITIFLSSSCGAIENPSLMALMPTLVTKEDYPKQVDLPRPFMPWLVYWLRHLVEFWSPKLDIKRHLSAIRSHLSSLPPLQLSLM